MTTPTAERAAIFSVTEIEGRQRRLREALTTAGLEGFLATSYPNSYYLSGAPIHPFGRPIATLIPRSDEPAMVMSIIEVEHVRLQTPIADLRTYWDFNPTPVLADPRPPLASMLAHLVAVIDERGLGSARIGYEDATLSDRHLRAIREAVPSATWMPASDIVDRQRLVLSQEELAILGDADAVADAGQRAILDAIGVGVSARELHEAAMAAMEASIRDRRPDAAYALRVTPGPGGAERSAGHSEWRSFGPTDAARGGDVLVSVLDGIVWGYTGNVERTIVIGGPSERVRGDFETMVEANDRAIEAVRPGVPIKRIDAICKEVFARAGHGTRTGSGVGRGLISYEGNHRILGLDLRPYNDLVLEEGMAFSIEPDLQTEDGTYRHCNTIIVTADGCVVDSAVERGVIVR
jgi:Xaa-Pro aminopeptidase